MATKQLSTIFLLFFPTTIVGIVNGQSPTNVRAIANCSIWDARLPINLWHGWTAFCGPVGPRGK
ncbi:hypothetical protein MKW94_011974, partial [Papaver nudicaule]|nr:hypothetical protein [Papaver nudicaule]